MNRHNVRAMIWFDKQSNLYITDDGFVYFVLTFGNTYIACLGQQRI